ncbi:hypothetical protein GCM10029978_071710 [Actinoallomurus acanthiterrae]
MDELKVALVLATAAGGLGRHVRSVADGLRARGAKVVVLGPASADALFGFTTSGTAFAPVEISDRPHPLGDVRAIARLRRLTRDADVVHAHGLRAGGLAALARVRTVPGPLRLGSAGPPLVVTLHNASIAGGLTGAAYATLERVVARGATEVLGVSPDLEERMRSLGARSVGLALVPAPAAPPSDDPEAPKRIRAELGAGDRPLILTVARLAEQKGLPTLLDAAAGWARLDAAPLVLIAGDGPLEAELRDRIAAERLPVRLLGRRTDVADLLAAADVAVVPSVWEGQPLIVQEILRAGPSSPRASAECPAWWGRRRCWSPRETPPRSNARCGAFSTSRRSPTGSPRPPPNRPPGCRPTKTRSTSWSRFTHGSPRAHLDHVSVRRR